MDGVEVTERLNRREGSTMAGEFLFYRVNVFFVWLTLLEDERQQWRIENLGWGQR